MIEPKDASKCDERQVKKKADFSTKKKEGETRMISNQGMNTLEVSSVFCSECDGDGGVFSSDAVCSRSSCYSYDKSIDS